MLFALLLSVAPLDANENGQASHLQMQVVVREDPASGRAEIEITNTGPLLAVAWSLEIISANGRRATHTQDNYYQLVEERREPQLLAAGQSLRIAGTSSARLSNAKVHVLAVVYSDGTALGSPVAIERIFAARREEADAWDVALAKLDALGQSPVGEQRLRSATAEIDDGTVTLNRRVREMILRNLKIAAAASDTDGTFRSLLTTLRLYARAARVHSVRH